MSTEPIQPKPIFKSKTIIVNVVIALSALLPPVQQFVQAHPTETLLGLTAINTGLRYITKGRLVLFAD
jgi:hypothetical protein